MDDLKLYKSSESELKVLVNEVHAYSKEICLVFGMDKCATLTIKMAREYQVKVSSYPAARQ